MERTLYSCEGLVDGFCDFIKDYLRALWRVSNFLTHTLSEDKKQPLVALPMSKKREMLTMSSKSMARTQFHSPADYIQYLSNSELSLQKKYSCIESLRVALTNNSLDWVQEFGTKGLKQVLSLLNECFRK